MNYAANTAFEAAKEAFASLAQGPRHIHWEDLPGWVRNYIVEHPGLTAAQTICLIVLAVPATITMPLLGALGFTSLGPAAGTAAAWFQATFGTTAVFSTLQSYMMAGYGVPIVGGIVQAGAAVAVVGTSVWA
ncbi:hypothetical protein KC332_g17716 [Hortaea werneckii]|uniref:Uncharacterized protein n=2 Tax=Hortaea werneckii TaxID=91943 RepID=A0A3M7J7V5_HORWE|nr:hypothetical protein KC350_g17955 [Hortaea werneckii]OTA31129.1 hypothetical protein BTJ68_10348 [Hortaea werneckii EXF-2000]KAI6790923.1 hypothetical protein KC358_g17897 [Hortaea werneckii]KAI6912398.1 hypothetical protein KC348_g12700 [Hortaea werneckii]KAI6928017.1 hypothetical protein KC341_g11790 [Hortaea werneckii]